MMIKFVSAAAILAAAAGAQGAFDLATHGFGDTAGQPYTTNGAGGFFIHADVDVAGDPVNAFGRPTNASNWTGAANGASTEWTSYFTEDAQGPSRRAGAPNNGADSFYLANGPVYAAAFANRNAALVTLGPGTNANLASSGIATGSSFITGPSVVSGQAPINGISGATGQAYQGIMLARLTVAHGATISGMPNIIGSFGTLNFVLNGPAVIGTDGRPYQVSAFLVNNLTITDVGQGGDEFGDADVYDIWVHDAVPAPGALALTGLAGLAGLRRRRA